MRQQRAAAGRAMIATSTPFWYAIPSLSPGIYTAVGGPKIRGGIEDTDRAPRKPEIVYRRSRDR